MQEVSIDYTYDALNRLTSATYSNGTKFAYTYDAAGNVLTYAATHYGLTTTTTYTYDEANQLLTATDPSTTTSTGSGQAWQYTYDGNGSLLQSDPGAGAANGSTRYTYNTAGYLVKVETYATDWQTQSEMKYDGLGNRLEMTTYVDGTASTTRYQLDNGQTLAAIGAESSTFYLNGMGVIGTLGESWSYILQDGAGSTRQLVDTEGAVQLSISYTPWGDTLEVYGSGMLNLGYMGGVYDAGTGLIYMGNGQYYDPSTGRFLTRGMKEESTNPYTPWNNDPVGMLIGPFGFLALLFAKKKKHTKLDAIIVVVILLALMGFGSSIAMPVQANSTTTSTYGGFTMPSVPMSYASSPQPATYKATIVANPGAPVQLITTDELCGVIDTGDLWTDFLGMAEDIVDAYLLGWKNFGTALKIFLDPNASYWQKEFAAIYMVFWVGAHYVLAAGLTLLAYSAYLVVTGSASICALNGSCSQAVINSADEAVDVIGKAVGADGDPTNEVKDIVNTACGGDLCEGEIRQLTEGIEHITPKLSQNFLGNNGQILGFDHIYSRHWYNTFAQGTSRFLQNFRVINLVEILNKAAGPKTGWIQEDNNYFVKIFEVGENIGYSNSGYITSYLKIIVDQLGNVVTAYPY